MPDWETAAWPRAEHLSRVFHVRSGASTGTAFALDVEGKQYLVSALHVLQQSIDTATVEIYFQNEWKPYVVNVIGANSEADIIVLALQERIVADNLLIAIDDAGYAAGQEVFILGFPLRFQGHLINSGFPIPLV